MPPGIGPHVLFVATACGFALACGVNDGGALVALSLRVPVFRPLTAVLVLAILVALAPVVVGTGVASTLARKLVPFSGTTGQTSAVVAALTAIAVVVVLARLHIPTSLSLALIGALVGAGLARGLPVSWPTLALVVVAGLLGPLVGAALAAAASTTLSALPPRADARGLVRRLHVVGYGAECLAYGTNDGQRMLAVFALTVAASPQVELVAWQLAAIALAFAIGAVTGMYRYAGTLGADLVPTRPHDGAVAELSGAGASLGAALVGAPLSMTQAVTGGLVGSASLRGWRRIRWTRTGRLALAWIVTLPGALVAAAAVAGLVQVLS